MSMTTLCPCINAGWPKQTLLVRESSSPAEETLLGNNFSDLLNEQQCSNISLTFTHEPFSSERSDRSVCVGQEFGSYCNNWWKDVYADNCTGDWCSSNWCFVSSKDCFLTMAGAHILEYDDKTLSYAACGNLATYDFDLRFNHLRGRTIRIAYPNVPRDGGFLIRQPDGSFDGSVVRFVDEIFVDKLQLNVEIRNVSEQSLSKYASPFTACVHDIALGLVDLCGGPYFRTPERLLLAPLTSSFFSSRQVLILQNDLVSTNTGQQSFWEYILTPFIPFTWQAWSLMVFCTLYMSIALRIIKRKLEGRRYLRTPLKELSLATYNGILSATSGQVSDPPAKEDGKTAIGEKFIIAGFCIFSFIISTAYEASFTLSLIEANKVDAVNSLKSIVDRGGKSGIPTSLVQLLGSISTGS